LDAPAPFLVTNVTKTKASVIKGQTNCADETLIGGSVSFGNSLQRSKREFSPDLGRGSTTEEIYE
jgi:hypothetical protein